MITLVQAQPGTRDNRPGDRRDLPPIDQRDRDVVEVTNHNPWDNDDDSYRNNDNRYGSNDNRYGNSRFGNERRMKMQIAQINREFDYKTDRVRNSFFLSRWDKQRQIRFLEEQRQQEIRKVYFRFKYKNRDNGCDFPDTHHY